MAITLRGTALLVAGSFLAVLTGCTRTTSGAAACPARIVYQGQSYLPWTLRNAGSGEIGVIPSSRLHPLGTARVPECDDVDSDPRRGTGETSAGTPVEVARIAGVDPDVAVATSGERIFVNRSAPPPVTLDEASWIRWATPDSPG
ncbi:DUF6281 family protein [Prauserella muralis]|uniref:DUF6281 family protein n=1 Tax=Prauserella muralis TaxID=588067 RepID=UPI003D15F9F1